MERILGTRCGERRLGPRYLEISLGARKEVFQKVWGKRLGKRCVSTRKRGKESDIKRKNETNNEGKRKRVRERERVIERKKYEKRSHGTEVGKNPVKDVGKEILVQGVWKEVLVDGVGKECFVQDMWK